MSLPRSSLASLAILASLILAGCGDEPVAAGPHYAAVPTIQATPVFRFAVHPLHNPTKLTGSYQPLVDFLNARLTGAALELETSTDYAAFEAKYRAREPAILLPNPWQTLQAMKHGYGVVAIAGEPDDFRGVIVVRRDQWHSRAPYEVTKRREPLSWR